MPACDLINTWFLTVTDLMITTLFQTVRSFLHCSRPHSHPHSDFRNKFGALHQSYTPNRERELYSEPLPPKLASRTLTESTQIVHLTSVTDTRRTHTIITSGKLTLHFAGLNISLTVLPPSSRLHFKNEPEDGRLHVIHAHLATMNFAILLSVVSPLVFIIFLRFFCS